MLVQTSIVIFGPRVLLRSPTFRSFFSCPIPPLTPKSHPTAAKFGNRTHLVQVDDRLPELVLQLVEIPHPDLPKVTRMVFVEIRAVVVLSSSHTASTGMLTVLSYTAVAGGDVAAAVWCGILAEGWRLCLGEVVLRNGVRWILRER